MMRIIIAISGYGMMNGADFHQNFNLFFDKLRLPRLCGTNGWRKLYFCRKKAA